MGIPISSASSDSLQHARERLLVDWDLGTLVIAGPKVLDLYDDFCSHRATSLKADGKDILSVTMILRAERDAQSNARRIVSEAE